MILSLVIVASIGALPVAIAVGTLSGVNLQDQVFLADRIIGGDAKILEQFLGGIPIQRIPGPASGPMEVVVGLEGRSLAAEQAYRLTRGMPTLDSAGQRAYVASLRVSQATLRATFEAAGARVLHSYQIVYNGIAVSADLATLQKIEAVPDVKRILPTAIYEIQLDNSVPFIFGGQTNADLGADGSGVTIAIIDSGIDYEHIDLGGSGVVADYTSNDPTTIADGGFPTTKVIDGFDLVGENYDARGFHVTLRPTCSSTPVPDPDPLDINGHGSHVAGIAAGIGAGAVDQGVAPGASLLAFKIFSGCALDGTASTSTTNIVAALEMAVDPDGDGDTSDHVDVVNMSLGGAFGRDTELGSVATNAVVDIGTFVAASAGNSGNLPYITGAPAAAGKAISVAAGNDPGVTAQLVNVANSAGADGNYESLEAAFTPPLSVTGTKTGLAIKLGAVGSAAARLCSALPAGTLTGKIPLIERGVCTFQAKITNAETAGAIAAVVYNNAASAGPIVMGGTAAGIPAVMVGNANGILISGAIDADTTFTLDPTNLLSLQNRLQSFTSRGPRFGDTALKPDITAPGGIIFSVDVGSGSGGVSLSGTSMSSPHIAGVAALLKELYPTWTNAEIKAVIMNTATNASPGGGVPYPLSLMGAGRVRVDVAVDAESMVLPGSASFGVLERDATGIQAFNAQLEVHNKGSATKKFSLSSAFLFAADNEGSVAFTHPSTLQVGPGGSKSFNVGLRINFNALAPEQVFEEYEGFLTLTETTSGGDVLRVPIHVVPLARSSAEATDDTIVLPGETGFTVANDGIRSTPVAVYQSGMKDMNEDLIIEGPGMPNDPDDWFDIRHIGARKVSATTAAFGLSQYGIRNVPSMMVTEVYIDVNGGGPDFVVQAADAFLFGLATGFTGQMVSGVFPLPSGSGSLQFNINSDRNVAWQEVPLLISGAGSMNALPGPDVTAADPDFDYFAVTYDLETGSFDVSPTLNFNFISPALAGAPNFIASVAAGGSAGVTVVGGVDGTLLVIYRNNKVQHPSQLITIDAP